MTLQLFLATLSQALQGFVPAAVGLAWISCRETRRIANGFRSGIVLSIPATALAAAFFRGAARQSAIESVLALAAFIFAVDLCRQAWRDSARSRLATNAEGRRAIVAAA